MKVPTFLTRKLEAPKAPTPEQWSEIQKRMGAAITEYNALPIEERIAHGDEGVQAHLQKVADGIERDFGIRLAVPPRMQEVEERRGEIVSIFLPSRGLVPVVSVAIWEMSGYGHFAVTDSTKTAGAYCLTDIETGIAVGAEFEDLKFGPSYTLTRTYQSWTPEQFEQKRRDALVARIQLEAVS